MNDTEEPIGSEVSGVFGGIPTAGGNEAKLNDTEEPIGSEVSGVFGGIPTAGGNEAKLNNVKTLLDAETLGYFAKEAKLNFKYHILVLQYIQPKL